MLRLSSSLELMQWILRVYTVATLSRQSHLGSLINSTGLSFLSTWLSEGGKKICPTPATVVEVMSYK